MSEVIALTRKEIIEALIHVAGVKWMRL